MLDYSEGEFVGTSSHWLYTGYVYMHICMHIYMYIYIYIYMCICMYTCICIYVCKYMERPHQLIVFAPRLRPSGGVDVTLFEYCVHVCLCGCVYL